MAAKIVFDVGPLDQEITVFAISAPMKDYRFIWYLNSNTEYSFMKDEPYIYYVRKMKQNLEFSVFRCPDVLDMFFISNRSGNTLLISGYKGVDFFLIWNKVMEDDEVEYWKSKLKAIPGITLAKQIEGNALIEFQNVVADMEYQQMERKGSGI